MSTPDPGPVGASTTPFTLLRGDVLHSKIISKGEAYDSEAINISIENILSTYYGERVFNPFFGCDLPATLFENLADELDIEKLLDNIIESIEMWENRIIILKDKVSVRLKRSEHALELYLPYVIKSSGITSSFEKRIIF